MQHIGSHVVVPGGADRHIEVAHASGETAARGQVYRIDAGGSSAGTVGTRGSIHTAEEQAAAAGLDGQAGHEFFQAGGRIGHTGCAIIDGKGIVGIQDIAAGIEAIDPAIFDVRHEELVVIGIVGDIAEADPRVGAGLGFAGNFTVLVSKGEGLLWQVSEYGSLPGDRIDAVHRSGGSTVVVAVAGTAGNGSVAQHGRLPEEARPVVGGGGQVNAAVVGVEGHPIDIADLVDMPGGVVIHLRLGGLVDPPGAGDHCVEVKHGEGVAVGRRYPGSDPASEGADAVLHDDLLPAAGRARPGQITRQLGSSGSSQSQAGQ